MPFNPMTGQFEYGGDSYDMPTMGAGMAATGMESVGANVPFAFRMMENLPSITGMALFNANRFANTMRKGGYRDVLDSSSIKKTNIGRAGQRRRAFRAGAFLPDANGVPVATAERGRFVSGARRNLTGKTPFLKQSVGNNFPRLRNLLRFQSLSNLSGMVDSGQYTPFQGASSFGKLIGRSKYATETRSALNLSDDAALFSGGILGRLSTMGDVYSAQMKSVRAAEIRAAKPNSIRANRLSYKANRTLGGIDRSLDVLGVPTSQSGVNQSMITRIAATAGGAVTQNYLDDVGALLDSDIVQRRSAAGLTGSRNPSRAAVARYREMFETIDQSLGGGSNLADDAIRGLSPKTARQMAVQAARAGETKIAGKLSLRYAGAQYAKFARPLNVVGAASVVYDLTKMAGEGLISAGNFAKDAIKSMQGSMRKPIFGMGFKDNEVAATSRARGVMAIQNSRLNARSMLGSEAGMMAAHFG